METLKRYMSGRHTRAEIRRHLAVLAVGYWGLVFCAWLGYPAEHAYSIKTHTLSALGSFDNRHNPDWYWLFSVAMVYCGVVMTPVIFYIWRRLAAISGRGAGIGAVFFLVGCAAIALTGLFPDAHGSVLGNLQWQDVHRHAAGVIAAGFSLGVIWYGVFLIRNKIKREALAEEGSLPYSRLIGPFLVCVPVFAAVGWKIEWGSVYAAIRAAASASGREIAAYLTVAVRGLESFPLLEHVAIWALTVFIIWFAVVLPHDSEPDAQERLRLGSG